MWTAGVADGCIPEIFVQCVLSSLPDLNFKFCCALKVCRIRESVLFKETVITCGLQPCTSPTDLGGGQ
jgi:hypothetical protein